MCEYDGYQVYEHQPYRPDDQAATEWYGDFVFVSGECDFTDTKAPDNYYIMPDILSGSDYSGSLVEQSNWMCFLEEFGQCDGVKCVVGGHGTFAVAITVEAYKGNKNIQEALNSLADYPVADEDHYSHMQMEKTEEAWEDWAFSDYESALEKAFDLDEQGMELNWSGQDAFEVFTEVAESVNEYWEEENQSMWIDVETVAEATTLNDLSKYLEKQ